jgi:hypothetical protein
MSDEMKQELGALRGEMHKGMGELHHEMGEVKAIVRNIAVEVSKLTGTMHASLQQMATKNEMKKEFGVIKGQLDDFTADVLSSRRERALQDESFNFLKDMLGDHERRLSNLEPPEKKS